MNPTLMQVWSVVASGYFIVGQVTMWAMSSTDLVDSAGTDRDALLNPERASWFVSLPLLMSIPGSILGGMLTERFGPRKLLLLLAPLSIVAFVAMHVASWQSVQEAGLAPVTLMTIRVIQSLVISLSVPATLQYPCEIAETRLRGTLGSLINFWYSIGFVICYLLGYYLHWTTMTLILPLTTSLPAFFLLLRSPESPIWLARNGMEAEARETLSSLRHNPEEVLKELSELDVDLQDEQSCMQSFKLLKHKRNVIPQTISILMIICKELGGSMVIIVLMVDIFKLTGVDLHPNLCSVIVGSVGVVCNLISTYILHFLPRRVILLSGITVTMLANASFGIIYFLEYKGIDITPVKWFPLAALMLFMIGYATGVGTSSWLVSTEILPNSIRSLGCGITVTVYSLTGFIALKTFHYTVSLIGLYGIFWFYSASCCAYWFLVFFFVPETLGLSLKEIEMLWVTRDEDQNSKPYATFRNSKLRDALVKFI